MIDLKLTPDQSQPTMLGGAEEEPAPLYPEDTEICLDSLTLRKLGISEVNLPQVGQQFALQGRVEVVEVCKEQGQAETALEVKLQITHLALGNDQQRARAQVDAMFG